MVWYKLARWRTLVDAVFGPLLDQLLHAIGVHRRLVEESEHGQRRGEHAVVGVCIVI